MTRRPTSQPRNAPKKGLTVDEFVIKAIDEKYEELKREK